MTDAHCHVTGGDASVREFLIGRDFIGIHPWDTMGLSLEDMRRKTEDLALRLTSSVSSPQPRLGVGEIGLDRLKEREISPRMREVFEVQLKLALEFHRPVVLHGAKCWGQVVETVERLRREVDSGIQPVLSQPVFSQPQPPTSTFLFHGFSRSDGLIPDIVALNGYISVGPAILNEHAVNYRELVRKIPLDRLLVETDRTPENVVTCPSVAEVAAKVAELRGLSFAELEAITDRNADAFICYNTPK
ncbi:MAG: TatD family hydrolase [bacterium]|nr:TatD family hydrolase [Candidatus Colisoma equi]